MGGYYLFSISAHHEDRQLRFHLPQSAKGFGSPHSWHGEVQKYRRDPIPDFFHQLQGMTPVLGADRLEPNVLQHPLCDFTDTFLVFDDENGAAPAPFTSSAEGF